MSSQFSFSQITGTLTGAALGADSDPNSVAPDAGRVVRVQRRREVQTPSATIAVAALNGTTITATPWVYDDELEVWWKLHIGVAVVPGGPAAIFTSVNLDGALVFVQLTANTDADVTCVGWYYG